MLLLKKLLRFTGTKQQTLAAILGFIRQLQLFIGLVLDSSSLRK